MLAVLLVLGLAAPSQASTPPLVNWGQVLPGFTPGLDLSSSNICTSGDPACVESVLRTMARDLHRLASTCDHNAVFQLGYMRTTEAYYESSQIPGFYDDVAWMHHYDAVFAEYYMGPLRAWEQGDASAVPPAWRQAFGAADGRELSALGNFLMGMNAHINRDLPFVLDDIGLTDADGDSRKPDHEQVNAFLNTVGDDMIPEIAARFDPTIDSTPHDDVLMGFASAQLIQTWREQAWTNAWLMTYTPEPVADLVAQAIEVGSAQLGALIRQATAIPDAAAQARDAHCADHWDDWDGGDGVYFDGQDEPPAGLPTLSQVVDTATIDALAAAGVTLDVSLAGGVQIELSTALLPPPLDGAVGLVGDALDGGPGGGDDGVDDVIGGIIGGLFGRR